MSELSVSTDKEPLTFCQLAMAFWLGSNHILPKLKEFSSFQQCGAYLYFGYYCFLALDKYSSCLDIDSSEYKELKRITQALLLYYNQHSFFLINAPKTLFVAFLSILKKINIQEKSLHAGIMKAAQQACDIELSRAFRIEDPTLQPEPNNLVTQVLNSTQLKPWDLGVLFTRLTTYNFQPHLFFLNGSFSHKYSWKKLILPARDGTLLEGLQVQKKDEVSPFVILVMAGHFQTEHKYFTKRRGFNFEEFQDVFSPASVVFINHRNYSNRAFQYANSNTTLGEDVACFANFFQEQNMEVILYGMCGGAYPIMEAAALLQRETRPFKLILDRFPSAYTDFFGLKNTIRNYSIFKNQTKSIKAKADHTKYYSEIIQFYIIGLCLLSCQIMLHLLLFFLNEKNDFTPTLAAIPKGKTLVLQATKTNYSYSHVYFKTDYIVHPDDDPHAQLRTKQMTILKELCDCCRLIISNITFDAYIKYVFQRILVCLHQAYELIENEQLKSNYPIKQTSDLHPEYIFNLIPQNEGSMNQFLRGFFCRPAFSCKKRIQSLPNLCEFDIQRALNKTYHLYSWLPEHERFAYHFEAFFSSIKENSELVSEVMNRLLASKITNFSDLLNKLLQTEFVRILETKCHKNFDLSSFAR